MRDVSREYRSPGLAERTVGVALRSFAQIMGCPVAYLERPRAVTVERLHDPQPVVRTFLREAIGVVSVPNPEAVALALDPAQVQELLALTRQDVAAGATLAVRAARLVVSSDPASVSVVDDQTLGVEPRHTAMLVYDPTSDAVDELRHDVGDPAWRANGAPSLVTRCVGALRGGSLVALASAEAAEGRLSRIRVLVAPGFGGAGIGELVLHALARLVLQDGLVPYVRLAATDLTARAMARTVGFVTFARGLTLQVTVAQPGFAPV